MKYQVLIGRILYSGIFIMALMGHFSQHAVTYAASKDVPYAQWLVPLSGLIAAVGGLSIALGYRAKAGAWLIIIFLIPVSFYMHAFWMESDEMARQMQMANFMKNASLLGAAFMISYFGSGPLSLDKLMEPKLKVKGFIADDAGSKSKK